MELVLSGFIAGVLTILAPCILPLLPVIVVGGASDKQSRKRPLIIIGSLLVSFFVFTLLIRGTTALIGVSDQFWQWLSAAMLIVIGLIYLFPDLWEAIAAKGRFNTSSNKLLGRAMGQKGWLQPVLIGASLGPVFVSCSPTYLIILTRIQDGSWAEGMLALMSYLAGLALVLLAIIFGSSRIQGIAAKAADPRGWFKRISGLIFLILGVFIATGYYKKVETWVLSSGYYEPIARLEESLATPAFGAFTIAVLGAGYIAYRASKNSKE